jgi:hypothetical protein
MLSFSLVGDAARAGHSWPASFRHTYRTRDPGSYRSLAGIFIPGDAPGILMPFAVFLRFAGECIFRRLEPACRFAIRPPRSFILAGSAAYCGPRVFGRGSRALAPRTSRTVQFAGPAIAFAHRADQIHQPLLPWASVLPSGFRRRSPVSTSGASPPMSFLPGTCDDSAVSRRNAEPALRRMQGTDD